MPETTTELMTDTTEAFTIEPWDELNQTMESNVHPKDWVNPTPSGRYNLVVLGAGTAGLVSAIGAAGLGAKVALVEKHLMGGDCLNVGCVPSKALIRAGRVAADMRRAHEFGVRTSGQVESSWTPTVVAFRYSAKVSWWARSAAAIYCSRCSTCSRNIRTGSNRAFS